MATYKLKLTQEFNNEELGPISLSDIASLAQEGKLNENTLVFNNITKAWDPVQTQHEIYTIIQNKGVAPGEDTHEILFSDPSNPSIRDTKHLKVEEIIKLKEKGTITPNTYVYCKEKHNWIPIKKSASLYAQVFENQNTTAPKSTPAQTAKLTFKTEPQQSKIKFTFKEDSKTPTPPSPQEPTPPSPAPSIIKPFDEETPPTQPTTSASSTATSPAQSPPSSVPLPKQEISENPEALKTLASSVSSRISLKGYEKKPQDEDTKTAAEEPPPPLTAIEKVVDFFEFQQSLFISTLYLLTSALFIFIHYNDLSNIWDTLLALHVTEALVSYPFIFLTFLSLGIAVNHITYRENLSTKRSLIYLSGIWYLLCIYWFIEDSQTVYYKIAFSGLALLILSPFTFHSERKINVVSRFSAALLLGYWFYYYRSFHLWFILYPLILVGATLIIDTFKFPKFQIIKVSLTLISILIVLTISTLYFTGIL